MQLLGNLWCTLLAGAIPWWAGDGGMGKLPMVTPPKAGMAMVVGVVVLVGACRSLGTSHIHLAVHVAITT